MKKAVLALMILLLPLLPATIYAASFDCKKAKTEVEKMICADAELSKLDEDLSALYGSALKSATNAEDRGRIKREQRNWLKARSACLDAACIKARYEERDLVLSNRSISAMPEKVLKRYPPYPDVWEYENVDPEWRVTKARRTDKGDVKIMLSPDKYGSRPNRTIRFFSPGQWAELSFEESKQIWGGISPDRSARFSEGSEITAGDSRSYRCYRKLDAPIRKYDSSRRELGVWFVLYILPKSLPYQTKPDCTDGPDFVERVGALGGNVTALDDDTFLLVDYPSGMVIRFDLGLRSKSKLVGSKVFVFTEREFVDVLERFGDERWQEAHDELLRILTTKAKGRKP